MLFCESKKIWKIDAACMKISFFKLALAFIVIHARFTSNRRACAIGVYVTYLTLFALPWDIMIVTLMFFTCLEGPFLEFYKPVLFYLSICLLCHSSFIVIL